MKTRRSELQSIERIHLSTGSLFIWSLWSWSIWYGGANKLYLFQFTFQIWSYCCFHKLINTHATNSYSIKKNDLMLFIWFSLCSKSGHYFFMVRFYFGCFSSLLFTTHIKCVFRVFKNKKKKEIRNKRRHTNNGKWIKWCVSAQAITHCWIYCAWAV